MRSLILTAITLAACTEQPPPHTHTHDGGAGDAPSGSWPFELPAGFPAPRLPTDARLSAELTELGRHLFYDKRLSGNGTQACATCHDYVVAVVSSAELSRPASPAFDHVSQYQFCPTKNRCQAVSIDYSRFVAPSSTAQ